MERKRGKEEDSSERKQDTDADSKERPAEAGNKCRPLPKRLVEKLKRMKKEDPDIYPLY